MNRKSFLKGLFGLAIAPKLISEINWEAAAKVAQPTTSALLTDLNLLIPDFYKSMVAKYGNENSYSMLVEYLKEPINDGSLNKFYYYE